MTKAAELVAMHTDELVSRLAESRRELLNLRFQLATGQLDNTARLRLVRREVARILSVMREREIAEIEGTFEPLPPPAPAAVPATVAGAETADAEVDDGTHQPEEPEQPEEEV
jgi:large subunit ribosomal protein L29